MRPLLLVATLWAAAAVAAPPRLAVLVVVDQLSTHLYEAYAPSASGGLRRLASEGFHVRELLYQYAPPVTAAGHATLATGAWPELHGVPANVWYDAELGRTVLPGEDGRFQLLGRAPEEGDPVAPTHLRVATLGDALKVRFPGARVVSVSGKDRSALMLGGEGADLALWVDRLRPAFTTSTRFAREVPAWLEPVNAALRAAAPEGMRVEESVDSLLSSRAGDAGVVSAALGAVRALGLGRDETPDLLLVSLSRLDKVLHTHGPQSARARAALADVDAEVGRLLAGLDAAVGRGRYVVALTADHGGSPVPEELAARGVPAGRVDSRQLMARLEQVADATLGEGEWFAAFSGHTGFYVRAEARARIHAADRALREAARSVPGVLDLLPGPALLLGTAASPLADLYRRGYVPGRSPDLVLVLAPYWIADQRDRATHVSPFLYDRQVPLLLAGPGVRRGRADSAEVVDVAPTLGRLLGAGPPAAAQGRVLGEALQ